MFKYIVDNIYLTIADNKMLSIESVNDFDGKKLAIVLAYHNKMISIEVLANFTCDLMIVDIDTEKILSAETHNPDSFEGLISLISKFLNDFK